MEPFLGQIQLFGFGFAPRGWAQCNGQLLSISSNTALFSLLGTTYGGNGQTTFGLPDLRGRVAVNQGQAPGLSDYTLGEVLGAETISLTGNENGQHNHVVQASMTSASKSPAGAVPAYSEGAPYGQPDGTVMNAAMTKAGGQGLPHENRQPTLCLNYCIALEGIYPSRD
jgi:microcystin-dependent protein